MTNPRFDHDSIHWEGFEMEPKLQIKMALFLGDSMI